MFFTQLGISVGIGGFGAGMKLAGSGGREGKTAGAIRTTTRRGNTIWSGSDRRQRGNPSGNGIWIRIISGSCSDRRTNWNSDG